MDFSRSSSSQPAAAPRASSASPSDGGKRSGSWKGSPKWLRVIWIILLFAVTILVVSMVALLYVGGDKESKLIDKSKFQAIFLTSGQVYFANIVTINDNYVDAKNIYYLSVNQQVQPEQKDAKEASVALVKLGCELHGPVDQMIINRDQVTFWENLKTDGQVSQAIDKWVEQNPEGQKCNTGTSQLQLDAIHKNS